MDEPRDVKAALDDSLASEVSDRVKKVVDDAERDAEAIAADAEEEAEAVLERARAEAHRIREDAARQARALGTDRVRRIIQLHRDLASRAEEEAALADDPETVGARVKLFLDALTARAELITREIGSDAVHLDPPAPVEDAEPPVEEDAAPVDEPSAPVESEYNGTAPEAVEAALAAVAARPSPAPLREARLEALRMAVAGASRTDLEAELSATLDPDDAAAVLDDVFGRPRSPFPKWGAAVKRTG